MTPDVVFLRKSAQKHDFCTRSTVVFTPLWWNGEQGFLKEKSALPCIAGVCCSVLEPEK